MEAAFIRMGGRLISTSSEEGKELLRWERRRDYNPDAPENQFPRMLYMAQKRPDGVVVTHVVGDEDFNRRCQRTVTSEGEMIAAFEQGWRKTQSEALARFQAREERFADEAAHRAHDDRNLSEPAKAEAAAVEAETAEHLPEVPEKRRVRRPRQPHAS